MRDSSCRICNSQLTETFVDLGESPLSNSYLDSASEINHEKFYPLHVKVCSKCFLVQLPEFQSPENIFSDYSYFSSFSDSWLEHSRLYVENIVSRFSFDSDSFVVEIASNDGYLLKNFVEKRVPVLGIEPAVNVAKVARDSGVPTETFFWGLETSRSTREKHGAANLIIANNVLAHVPDIRDFVSGIKAMLADDGICTFEFPHLVELIRYSQFDTIYHEHFSYLSLYVVSNLFDSLGLRVFDIEKIPTHGGSLRVYGCHKNGTQETCLNVAKVLSEEIEFGIENLDSYRQFTSHVERQKVECHQFLRECQASGKSIVGYGAPAKGNTFLNFMKIGSQQISFTVDKNPHKQNKLLPGSHLPIKDPESIFEEKPDYLWILPWNLKDEIETQMAGIRDWGGQFVIAIPELKVY